MKLKNLLLLTVISLLFNMCASRRTVVVQNQAPPPMWGPMGHETIRYYYLPDMMVYYDVHTAMFFYPQRNRWIRRSYLPAYYSHFDLYNTYKVVLHDYYGPSPYHQFNNHRNLYGIGYRGTSAQSTIGRRDQDNRNYFSSVRNQTRNTGGRNTQSSSQGQGRNTQANSQGRTQTTQNGGRTNNGSRTQTNTGTRNNSQNSTNTSPSNRDRNINPESTRGNNAQTPGNTRSQTNANASRANTRLNSEDATAAKKRTQEVKQQSRSNSSSTRSTNTNEQSPRSSSSGRPRS